MTDQDRSRLSVAVPVAVVVVILAAAYNFLAVGTACGWDTSYCAMGQERTTAYTGRFPGVSSPTRFEVSFESRRRLRPVPFTTDATGRFCFIWAEERVTPFPQIGGAPPVSVKAATGAASLAPPGCQTSNASIPWNRTDAIDSAWQPQSIDALVLLALIALGTGALLRGRARRVARTVGLAAASAAPVLCVLVWATAA